MASSWIAYNEPAWTEDLLADLSDYEGEAGGYIVDPKVKTVFCSI